MEKVDDRGYKLKNDSSDIRKKKDKIKNRNKKMNQFCKVIFSVFIWISIGILQYYFLIYFTEYVIWDLAQNTNSGYLLGRKIPEEELEQDFELEIHSGCKYGKSYLLKKYKREGSYFYDQYVRVEKYSQAKKSFFRVVYTRERDVEVYGIQEGTGLEEARQILYQRGYIKIRNSKTKGVERTYFRKGGVFITIWGSKGKISKIELNLQSPDIFMMKRCSFHYGVYRIVRWWLAVHEANLLN